MQFAVLSQHHSHAAELLLHFHHVHAVRRFGYEVDDAGWEGGHEIVLEQQHLLGRHDADFVRQNQDVDVPSGGSKYCYRGNSCERI